MKKYGITTGLIALLAVLAAYAAQDTSIKISEVRNPKKLQTFLEGNAADAESRLVAGQATSDTLALINAANTGVALMKMTADNGADAGDITAWQGTDGSGMAFQSDITSKGNLATKLTISTAGVLDLPSLTVDAAAGIDVQSAGALKIGEATATSIEIGDAGVTTDIQGPVTLLGTTGAGLDSVGATALYIGEATCTSLSRRSAQ